jgi:hypothetical protein
MALDNFHRFSRPWRHERARHSRAGTRRCPRHQDGQGARVDRSPPGRSGAAATRRPSRRRHRGQLCPVRRGGRAAHPVRGRCPDPLVRAPGSDGRAVRSGRRHPGRPARDRPRPRPPRRQPRARRSRWPAPPVRFVRLGPGGAGRRRVRPRCPDRRPARPRRTPSPPRAVASWPRQQRREQLPPPGPPGPAVRRWQSLGVPVVRRAFRRRRRLAGSPPCPGRNPVGRRESIRHPPAVTNPARDQRR